jgi:hypothetical protein
MFLLETLRQDLRYATRTLLRNGGYTTVSVFALALGIGINTVAFTAYKAFVARPLDARDPSTLVNFALRLRYGTINARFSYPDYESYRDHLHSFTGVIAFSIDQLRLNGRRRRKVGKRGARVVDGKTGGTICDGEKCRICQHLHRFGELLLGSRGLRLARSHLRIDRSSGTRGIAFGSRQPRMTRARRKLAPIFHAFRL